MEMFFQNKNAQRFLFIPFKKKVAWNLFDKWTKMRLMCHLNFILEAQSGRTGKLPQYIDSFA